MASLARALHIPDDFLEATPEVAPLAAIAGETPHLNLAPSELLQHHDEFLWRRGLRVAAATVALLGFAVTAGYWLQAQHLRDEADIIALQQRQLAARYQAVARTFPVQTTAPEQLAQTVALAQQLARPQLDARTLFAALGPAFDTLPDIALEGLSWSEDPSGTGGASVKLEAALMPFDGNYRAAMHRIEQFMNHLRSTPGIVSVALSSSPVDANSSSSLSGKTLAPDATEVAARFSLTLRYGEVPQ
jgi:hypothetical protein